MGPNETSHTNEDIARLFRENDNVGPGASLWLRPLRQLFNVGKPMGQVVALTFALTEQSRFPFGMLTETQKNRIVFWPVLPPHVNMICAGQAIDAFDHITLDLPNEKIHVTGYDVNGKAVHESRSWRTYPFSDCNLSLWFLFMVRDCVIQQQDMAVQRRVPVPPTDKERRTDEFVRFTQSVAFSTVPLPPANPRSDYIYGGIYLAREDFTAKGLPASILPADRSLDTQVDECPAGSEFPIAVSRVPLGDLALCFATARPPGKLKTGVCIGFPHR